MRLLNMTFCLFFFSIPGICTALPDDFQKSLDAFYTLAQTYKGPVSDSFQITPSTEKKSQFHLVIATNIHGDEIGPLQATVEFANEVIALRDWLQGTVTVFIGNPKATMENKRFVEKDLNRAFAATSPQAYEEHRAEELKPLLASATLFVDLHQTIEPTKHAFYTFAYSEKNYLWAKYLGEAEILTTRKVGKKFAENLLTATEFVMQSGGDTVAIELFQKGLNPETSRKVANILRRALKGLTLVAEKKSATHSDLAILQTLTKHYPGLRILMRAYNQPFTDPTMRLDSGFENFSPVTKNQRVGWTQKDTPLLVPEDGLLLFPKYPIRNADNAASAERPSDLFLLFREG